MIAFLKGVEVLVNDLEQRVFTEKAGYVTCVRQMHKRQTGQESCLKIHRVDQKAARSSDTRHGGAAADEEKTIIAVRETAKIGQFDVIELRISNGYIIQGHGNPEARMHDRSKHWESLMRWVV